MKIKLNRNDIASFLIVISPILSTYATPIQAISYGEIGIISSMILLINKHMSSGDYREIKKQYVIFAIYAVFVTFIMSLIFNFTAYSEIIKETATIIIYLIILFFLIDRVNVLKLMDYYLKVAYICSCFLIIQFLVHVISGRWIPGILPGVMTDAGIVSDQFIASMARASSFFKEPAHYCQFIVIPFVYLLFSESKTKSDIKKIIVYILSLLLTLSGNGMMVLGVALACYWFKLIFSGKGRTVFKGILFVIVITLIGIVVLFATDFFDPIIVRLYSGELLGNNPARVSGYVRVVRGYIVFNDFKMINKIFGVGFGNYVSYALNNCYKALTLKTSYSFSYINGIQYYLTSTGILGLIMYLAPICKQFRFGGSFKKTIICEFLILCSISGINKGAIWLLFLLVVLCKFDLNDNFKYQYIHIEQ